MVGYSQQFFLWMAARLQMARFTHWLICGIAAALFSACSVNEPRPYYNRKIGAYLIPDGRNASLSVSPKDLPPGNASGRLRKVAESYLGIRYRFGGQSRTGMDCSGFVRQVFSEAFQINLPHNSASMASLGESVSRSDLQPGDILLFKNMFFIDHSAIYMGQGWFIHSQSGNGVVYTRLDAPYFSSHYAGARRMLH
jgi:murein DD-endopeptidase / murein LD-carboxypeptidase